MSNSIARRLMLAMTALSVFGALPADGQTIHEDLELYTTDGVPFVGFGWAIDIDHGVVVSGARSSDTDNSEQSGAAYLFDAFTGVQLLKLFANDAATLDRFGVSVGIDNGIVAVGASYDDDQGAQSGSAYLFKASSGAQLLKLLPSDGAAGDQFGHSIAIDNGVVAVGAINDDDNGFKSGAVYLFDAFTGVQLLKLLPSDGTVWDQFGYSVAIDNSIVVVGAYFDSDNSPSAGAAYLFDVSTGTQLFKLFPNGGAIDDRFGSSVAVHNGVVAVGAPGTTVSGFEAGAAYTFDAITGGQIAMFVPIEGAPHDLFGTSIAIEDGVVGVGALYDDDLGPYSGASFFFDAFTGAEIAKFLPSDGVDYDGIGSSFAIDNGVAIVGAFSSYGLGSDTGSVYVLGVPSACLADLTGDGALDFFDVSAFLSAFGAQDPLADFAADGSFDFFDVSAFLQLFAAGCP